MNTATPLTLLQRLEAASAEGLEANARRFLQFIGHGTVELQILGVDDRFAANRFAHPRSEQEAVRLLQEAERLTPTGIYVLFNEPDEAVATRKEAGKWHPTPKGNATTDDDIRKRRALFIDIDASRIKGTSATVEELSHAMRTAEKVQTCLETIVGSRAIGVGHSGNGAAVFLALAHLEETPALAALCKGLLAALAYRFSEESGAEIDVSVCDAKRLCPAFGTTKRKGAAGLERRPHRRTGFLSSTSGTVERLTVEDLQRLLQTLEDEMDETGHLLVDKAMARKRVAPPAAPTTPTRPADQPDPFATAKAIPIRHVLQWLGLLDGDDRPKCPGCGLDDQGVAIVGNGVKCSHNRCASKGRPAGFRTTIDAVMESKGLQRSIEAVRLMADRFGFTIPSTKAAKRKDRRAADDDEPAWYAELARSNRGEIAKSVGNVITILSRDPAWAGVIVFDEFAQTVRSTKPPPWDDVDRPSNHTAGDWSDQDDTRVSSWLTRHYDLHVGDETVHRAIDVVSRQRTVNPPLAYLNGLQWDGTARIDQWLSTYLGVAVESEDEAAYTRMVGRFFLISAVARLRRPGCKVDTMLVLEGNQGARKSTAVATLFSRQWTTDTPPDLNSKDRFDSLRDCWCVEWAELDGMGRADVDRLKNFLSSAIDDYRPAYGRSKVRIPRRSVFFGSVNKSEYLRDETGNRRFWPVRVGEIDIEAIERDRDQLWAEAVAHFESKPLWWPARTPLPHDPTRTELDLFKAEQSDRVVGDPWLDIIREYAEPRDRVTVAEVLETALAIEKGRWTPGDQNRVSRVLVLLGRRRQRDAASFAGKRQWFYGRSRERSVQKSESVPASSGTSEVSGTENHEQFP